MPDNSQSVEAFTEALTRAVETLNIFGSSLNQGSKTAKQQEAAVKRREQRLIGAALKLGGAGAFDAARFGLSGLSGDLTQSFQQGGLRGLAGVANKFLFGGDPVEATGSRINQALGNAIAFAPEGTDFKQQIDTLRDIFQPQENRRQRGQLQIQQSLAQQDVSQQGEAGKILGTAIEKLSDAIAELILFAGEFAAGNLFQQGR